jgi:hypothetical protein
MAANGKFTVQAALTTTLTTNIFGGAVTSLAGPTGLTLLQPYYIINHIRILNKTGTAATFTLYKGGTGGNVAGTEIMGTAVSVAANSYVDYYAPIVLSEAGTAQFIVGGAGTVTALVIQIDGEIGFPNISI